MFRKPRNSTTIVEVGRPPSPRATPAKTPFTLAIPPDVPPPSKMAVAKTRTPSRPVPLPTIGRQGAVGSAKKLALNAKAKEKGNGNIMAFFKKEEAGLFCVDSTVQEQADADEMASRFNEDNSPQKRRRLSAEDVAAAEKQGSKDSETDAIPGELRTTASSSTRKGPFMEDSDDGEEEDVEVEEEPHTDASNSRKGTPAPTSLFKIEPTDESVQEETLQNEQSAAVPLLLKQETSAAVDLDEFRDFEGVEEDFDEDIYEGGDEYLERKYMEEQARIEQLEACELSEGAGDGTATDSGIEASPCPICGTSLASLTEHEAVVHVNHCLDGGPAPSEQAEASSVAKSEKLDGGGQIDPRQFRRVVRPPKPGQQNPFTLGEPTMSNGSAFTQLMSGHAEDIAWAEAALSEQTSRGKPAYQRTCPFYKILPGLFICVDAFRYGAVAGCKAYFLSHFHSDHYVGLTSNWCHGPIYCSHVTANLVRQQLRVDPRYVVDLEFEKPVEVPGTKGVQVTMISANHCPGSSLYLFEKVVGKKTNGQPRVQRVLHCGDFRACRMHVEHPLLIPEVRDKITGTTSEQKIDVCYLDTTYLNPKYAFPSQQEVIKACADMCISLSKITPDESDGWEQMKRQRAGEGMVKFVRRESSGVAIKDEPVDDAASNNDMQVEQAPNASQQILSSNTSKINRGRLLVVVGTYSIGKERICLGIAKALNSKIFAPSSKQRIVAALEDPELDERMTGDPRAAQVHMTPLFEIRAETLDDYLKDYYPHFTRAVGFRPSGWNYKPPNSRFTDSPSVQTVLYSDNWKSSYSMRELVPQRGSSSRASCFGVPYSEHSSFRELTMFCCALRIDKIIPTVNVGSAKSRERMKAWIERWQTERKKNGLYTLPEDGTW